MPTDHHELAGKKICNDIPSRIPERNDSILLPMTVASGSAGVSDKFHPSKEKSIKSSLFVPRESVTVSSVTPATVQNAATLTEPSDAIIDSDLLSLLQPSKRDLSKFSIMEALGWLPLPEWAQRELESLKQAEQQKRTDKSDCAMILP
jgi:hypothetical protein